MYRNDINLNMASTSVVIHIAYILLDIEEQEARNFSARLLFRRVDNDRHEKIRQALFANF